MSSEKVWSEEALQAREVLMELSESGLKAEDVGEEKLLVAGLGIDSLQFIRLILEVEEKLKRKIFHVGNIAGIKTVGDLLRVVEASRI